MKRGDMIRVLQMEDYNGIDIQAAKMNGNIYIVDYVDDAGQIHMKWDNGRTLAIVPSEDDFRKLTDEELAEGSETEETENIEQTM